MADQFVTQDGTDSGDSWTTLNAALDAVGAGDTVHIQEAWTIDDTVKAFIVADCTIITEGTSRHPGYWDETQEHYRLVTSGNDHSLSLDGGAFTATIDGLAIEKSGTNNSTECFRCNPAPGDTILIKNCLLRHSSSFSSQDGIYTAFNVSTGDITVENCVIWGSERGGIHVQNESGDCIMNINSCTVYNNGLGGGATDGGIVGQASTGTVVINIHNSLIVGNTTSSAGDLAGDAAVDWNVGNSIVSDASITALADDEGGTTNLESVTVRESTGGSPEVILVEIDIEPFDLRLVDDDTNNDAQNFHSDSEVFGLTIPANDIVGTSRNNSGSPVQGTKYDVGAFEVIVAAGGLSILIAMHHYKQLMGVN